MRTLLSLVFSLGLSACCIQMPTPRPDPLVDDDGGVLGPPVWPEGTLSFGTTNDEGEVFQEIGEQLTLHRGPQGGNHAYAKYKVSGGQVARDTNFVHRVRRARDGLLVSQGSRPYEVLPGDGGVWLSESTVNMILCPTAPGVNIVNELMNFEVTATGADGKFLGRATVSSTLSCTGCEADCGG